MKTEILSATDVGLVRLRNEEKYIFIKNIWLLKICSLSLRVHLK
jgi:hypothetical protein